MSIQVSEGKIAAQAAWENLSKWEKFQVKYLGKAIFVSSRRNPGCSRDQEFYIFKCSKCGEIAVSYHQGHDERLTCSKGHYNYNW